MSRILELINRNYLKESYYEYVCMNPDGELEIWHMAYVGSVFGWRIENGTHAVLQCTGLHPSIWYRELLSEL